MKRSVPSSPPGGPPVSTDVEGDGATPDDSVETEVSSPNGGTVTIEDGPSDLSTALSGYSFFGEQMTITAPSATVNEPLVLKFVLDASKIPAGAVGQHRRGVPQRCPRAHLHRRARLGQPGPVCVEPPDTC